MHRWAIVAATGILVACGGGSDKPAPEQAMENYIDLVLKQQGGRAYDYILPEQAALIDRDLYIGCMQENDVADVEVEATDSYTETIDVPELGSTETWAVTVSLSDGDDSQNATRHLIERGDDFYTFFPADTLSTYASGECP